MVVGNGMMAQAFSAYAGRTDVLIFASGVSDSAAVDDSAFRREASLLQDSRERHPEALLVYFGTCSVYDPELRETPYVRHKLRMEAVVAAAAGPWLILRAPLAIGPASSAHTLAHFLHERIRRGEKFALWAGASRYPLDVEDLYRIAERLIENRASRNRIVDVALRSYPVLEFVRVLERITGRRAHYRAVSKGASYTVESPEVEALSRSLGLDASEDYLERVLRKYFDR